MAWAIAHAQIPTVCWLFSSYSVRNVNRLQIFAAHRLAHEWVLLFSGVSWCASGVYPGNNLYSPHVLSLKKRTSSNGLHQGIFDETDHLRQRNVKKDHLWKLLPKKTSAEWRHAWAGGTWHLPPLPSPAGTCRHCHRRHVAGPVGRVGPPQHAATPIAGRVTWQHAATPIAGTLPSSANACPTLTSMLTAVFFRRESGRNWYVTCDMQSVLFFSVVARQHLPPSHALIKSHWF
jgi:hypothetical protein